MRVLFVSSQVPFPETRFGGAKRLYYLAKELDARCELSVISLDGNRELNPGVRVAGGFRREMILPLEPRRRLRGRLEFLPGVAGVLARNAGAIRDFLGPAGFDATLMAYPLALRFLDVDWPFGLGRLVFTDDDLLLEQYRKQAEEGSLGKRLLGRLRHGQALRFFGDRLARVSACVCISREEQAVINGCFPAVPTRVLKYGLPLEEYPCLPASQPASVIGFIGNFRHPPNADALSWLLDGLFPALKARAPEARLVVAGRHIPEGLKARCAADPSVGLMEDVEDLSSFYRAVGLFVIPVRTGRGMRTKAVEAAAFGRPILATALGAEGLEELDIPTFSDAAGFAESCLALAEPARYRAAAEGNRRAAEAEFSLAALGGKLEAMLAGAGTGRAAPGAPA